MAEYPIKPSHNVFKKYRTVNYINSYVFAPHIDLSTNTEIGGVAASLGTPALLASKLAIDVSRITGFSVVGSDIKCKITGSYPLPIDCFRGNNNITYYKDTDNLVNYIGNDAFTLTTKMKRIDFDGVLSIGTNIQSSSEITEVILRNCLSIGNELYTLPNNKSLKLLCLPKLTSLGTTSGNENILISQSINMKIIVPIAMQTSNSGGVEGDLIGRNVTYVSNFTKPSAITDLVGLDIYSEVVKLNFTTPISANTIMYYEFYANGIFKNTSLSTGYIEGLANNTNYNITVHCVDIFGNKSLVSNSINVTTSFNTNKDEANLFVTATSNVNNSQITAINNLTTTLKNNGLFFKLKSLNIKVGGTVDKHKFNLIDARDLDIAHRYSFNGSWIHSPSGAQPNGTGAYANTFLNLSTMGNGKDFCFGYYLTVPNTIYGDRHAFGAYSSGNNFVGFQYNTSTQLLGYSFGAPGTPLTVSTGYKGFCGMVVNDSVKKMYHNTLTTVASVNGSAPPNLNIYEGAMNVNNSPSSGINATYGTSFIGIGLNSDEIALLQSAIITFETALGRNV